MDAKVAAGYYTPDGSVPDGGELSKAKGRMHDV